MTYRSIFELSGDNITWERTAHTHFIAFLQLMKLPKNVTNAYQIPLTLHHIPWGHWRPLQFWLNIKEPVFYKSVFMTKRLLRSSGWKHIWETYSLPNINLFVAKPGDAHFVSRTALTRIFEHLTEKRIIFLNKGISCDKNASSALYILYEVNVIWRGGNKTSAHVYVLSPF